METIYHYWDIGWWWIERCIFWVLLICIVMCSLVWVWEEIVIPFGGVVKEAWWRWTKRCPECDRSMR